MVTEATMRTRSRLVYRAALAALLAAAIVPLPAGALFQLDYNGHVKHDRDSYVGFNLKRTSAGKRKVAFFTTGRIQFVCRGGSVGRTELLTLDGSFRVKHRKFKGKVHVFTPAGDPVAVVRGKLHRDRRVASGTIRLAGKLDPSQPDLRCRTGTQEWRATRGAEA
jgi:hypothetical protein